MSLSPFDCGRIAGDTELDWEYCEDGSDGRNVGDIKVEVLEKE
jgi:hypothetical protein